MQWCNPSFVLHIVAPNYAHYDTLQYRNEPCSGSPNEPPIYNVLIALNQPSIILIHTVQGFADEQFHVVRY